VVLDTILLEVNRWRPLHSETKFQELRRRVDEMFVQRTRTRTPYFLRRPPSSEMLVLFKSRVFVTQEATLFSGISSSNIAGPAAQCTDTRVPRLRRREQHTKAIRT
jgi:hypothetical protein